MWTLTSTLTAGVDLVEKEEEAMDLEEGVLMALIVAALDGLLKGV